MRWLQKGMTGWQPGTLFWTVTRPCHCVWHSRLPDDENCSASRSCYVKQQKCHKKWPRRRTPLLVSGTPHLCSVIAMVCRANLTHLCLDRAAGFLDPIPEWRGNLGTLLPRIPVVPAAGTLWIASPPEPLVPGKSRSRRWWLLFQPERQRAALGICKSRVQPLLVTHAEVSAAVYDVHCWYFLLCLFQVRLFYFYGNILHTKATLTEVEKFQN